MTGHWHAQAELPQILANQRQIPTWGRGDPVRANPLVYDAVTEQMYEWLPCAIPTSRMFSALPGIFHHVVWSQTRD